MASGSFIVLMLHIVNRKVLLYVAYHDSARRTH